MQTSQLVAEESSSGCNPKYPTHVRICKFSTRTMQNVSSAKTHSLSPRHRLAKPSQRSPVLLKPLLAILPAPKRINMDRQSPSQRPHRNQIPYPPPAQSLPADHHCQKINLRGSVRHMFPRSPPASPHRKPFVMPRPASLHLHPPQPPRSIHNHVIALIVPKRLRHAKPAPGSIKHELHLSHLPKMLRVISPPPSTLSPTAGPFAHNSPGNNPRLVWSGHSCPLPLTLILTLPLTLILTLPLIRARPRNDKDLSHCRKAAGKAARQNSEAARTTVEERRFSGLP
jgi:hypothetical protein